MLFAKHVQPVAGGGGGGGGNAVWPEGPQFISGVLIDVGPMFGVPFPVAGMAAAWDGAGAPIGTFGVSAFDATTPPISGMNFMQYSVLLGVPGDKADITATIVHPHQGSYVIAPETYNVKINSSVIYVSSPTDTTNIPMQPVNIGDPISLEFYDIVWPDLTTYDDGNWEWAT